MKIAHPARACRHSAGTITGSFLAFAFMSLVASAPVLAQEFSGFLDDYSDLQEVTPGVYIAMIPDPEKRVAKFDAIMVDQPEFFLDDDSKYSGLKPDEVKLIVDTLRQAMMTKFERSSYRLVSTTGPSTLYLRTAITEVGMKKKKKNILQFTPIGLAATLATSPLKDVMDKTELQRYTIEAELVESTDGTFIGHFVDRSRSVADKNSNTSWETAGAELTVASARMVCRLENAKLPPDGRTDCVAAIPFEDSK